MLSIELTHEFTIVSLFSISFIEKRFHCPPQKEKKVKTTSLRQGWFVCSRTVLLCISSRGHQVSPSYPLRSFISAATRL